VNPRATKSRSLTLVLDTDEENVNGKQRKPGDVSPYSLLQCTHEDDGVQHTTDPDITFAFSDTKLAHRTQMIVRFALYFSHVYVVCCVRVCVCFFFTATVKYYSYLNTGLDKP